MRILIEAYKPHDSNLVDSIVKQIEKHKICYDIVWLDDEDMLHGCKFGIYVQIDGLFERMDSVQQAISKVNTFDCLKTEMILG